MVFNCRSLLNAAADLAALRQLRSPFAIRDANSEQRQKYMKNLLLLWTSARISRYGPRLMIVMIFVTQNNFSNGPGIFDRLLGHWILLVQYIDDWGAYIVTKKKDDLVISWKRH